MKNLFLTLTAGLFLLTACSKDESFEQIDAPSNDLVYVLEQNGNTSTFTSIALENRSQGPTTPSNNFGESSGMYEPIFEDPIRLTWSGLQDDTGTFGTAELQIIRPTYSLHIIMETECIMAEGNKAVYGGTITQVVTLSGNAPQIAPMWRFYFQVTDVAVAANEQGGIDRISNKWIFASPMSPSLCSVYPPSHRIWSTNGYAQVIEPGFVYASDHPQ